MLGCPALLVGTIESFGTLKIADVLEPAIRLAEGGFVLLVFYTSSLAPLRRSFRVPVSELNSFYVGVLRHAPQQEG